MSERYFVAIFVGVLWGLVNRILLLRVDYRAYPSYPHAYMSHLAFGFLASLVGTVAPVALAAQQFDAVTFLLLVATQFREIRKMERDKLVRLESIELVPRGANYIEGIAEVFELRNYLIMFVSAAAAGAVLLWGESLGVLIGLILVAGTQLLRSDLRLDDVAKIHIASVRFEGPQLFVEDVDFMNVALPDLRARIEKWGVGVVIEARNSEYLGVLDNFGQRQAIIHDLVHVLGNRADVDTSELKPQVRKNLETGKMALYFCPMDNDPDRILNVAAHTPILSNARRGSGEGL